MIVSGKPGEGGMETRELNFVLKLLGCPDYRAPIWDVKPSMRTKSSERDRICRQLRDRGWVDCFEEIVTLEIAPPGAALLKLDTSRLPISAAELKVLNACAESAIPPSETGLEAEARQEVIRGLIDRGLVCAKKTKIAEVWLTDRGLEYLRDEYTPSGSALAISLDLLANYLRFLRKSPAPEAEVAAAISTPTLSPLVAADKPNDEAVLDLIRHLDGQLGTDNYLPIFYLREKLQPPLTREELDSVLYRLQRYDKIELSSLQEAINYTAEQIDTGIPQDIGGPLFFIIQL
ncbi:MAG: hypothetical protein SWY16_03160 [Cyanobacteriota bacterium]|nr:hypothetical protein [Cyanobacteriota bacterium]